MSVPTTMRAWQYTPTPLALEKSLKINAQAPVPKPKPNQHLIQVQYCSLNPVDYKPAENPIMRRLVIPNPATPGIDYAGTIVKPAEGSSLKVGDKVFGCGPSPFAGGMLAEYAVAGTDATIPMPQGLSMVDASSIGVAGLTAWQSIISHKPSKVFINGGSGGTGCFGIQISKAMGYDVTVTCSTRNIELCKSLGADHVIDYTKSNIVDELKGKQFDHVVDNVMSSLDLYMKAHEYTTPNAKYITVAGEPSLKYMSKSLQMKFRPSWLGGGRRHAEGMLAKPSVDQLGQIAAWIAEGKVRAVIDSEFAFEDATKAFEKLKTGRARGKIVVQIASDAKA